MSLAKYFFVIINVVEGKKVNVKHRVQISFVETTKYGKRGEKHPEKVSLSF